MSGVEYKAIEKGYSERKAIRNRLRDERECRVMALQHFNLSIDRGRGHPGPHDGAFGHPAADKPKSLAPARSGRARMPKGVRPAKLGGEGRQARGGTVSTTVRIRTDPQQKSGAALASSEFRDGLLSAGVDENSAHVGASRRRVVLGRMS